MIIILLYILLFILFAIILLSISINYKSYKYYKITYDKLASGSMYLVLHDNNLVVLDDNPNTTITTDILYKKSTIIFFKDGSIKLYDTNDFLINKYYTWFDLYSFYYLKKINNLYF